MVFQRLLNMELALSRRRIIQPTPLSSLLGLPVEEMDACDVDAVEADLSGDEESENRNLDGLADERQEIPSEETLHKSKQSYPPVFGICCGGLPHQSSLDEWLSLPSNLDRRSAEGRYAKDYILLTHEAKVSAEHIQIMHSFIVGDGQDEDAWSDWTAACIKAKDGM